MHVRTWHISWIELFLQGHHRTRTRPIPTRSKASHVSRISPAPTSTSTAATTADGPVLTAATAPPATGSACTGYHRQAPSGRRLASLRGHLLRAPRSDDHPQSKAWNPWREAALSAQITQSPPLGSGLRWGSFAVSLRPSGPSPRGPDPSASVGRRRKCVSRYRGAQRSRLHSEVGLLWTPFRPNLPAVPGAGQEIPSSWVHRPDTNRQPYCALVRRHRSSEHAIGRVGRSDRSRLLPGKGTPVTSASLRSAMRPSSGPALVLVLGKESGRGATSA